MCMHIDAEIKIESNSNTLRMRGTNQTISCVGVASHVVFSFYWVWFSTYIKEHDSKRCNYVCTPRL